MERKEKVLVVDDDPDMRLIHGRILGSIYDVSLATDGVEALEQIRAERPDLVLTDNVMPNKSGIELLIDIRGDEHLKNLPVIVLSALDEVGNKVQGLESGADDYLPKPVDPRELKVRVHSILLKSRYEQQLAQKNGELEEAFGKLQQTLEELQDTQAELIHSSKLASIGELAAGMAHEINNPALAVNNAFEIIERKLGRVKKGKSEFSDVVEDVELLALEVP